MRKTEHWGKVLELLEKKDRFRLGYQPSLGKEDFQVGKGQVLPMQKTFTSSSHIFGGQVAMVDEVTFNEATPYWVRQGVPGEELRNWKSIEIS